MTIKDENEHLNLLTAYRSGQVSEAQWVQHLADPEFKAFVEKQTATSSQPFGVQPEQHAYILEGINDLRCRVNALPNSREKSTMLTKLDELRHWNEDDRLRSHFEAGGH